MKEKPSQGYRMLVLTDHRIHTHLDSMYHLLHVFLDQPDCFSIHVASRGVEANESFFQDPASGEIQVAKVDHNFRFHADGSSYHPTFASHPDQYDVIFFRLPRASHMAFFQAFREHYGEEKAVNRLSGIEDTGNKKYLLHFPQLCAPMQLCHTVEEIDAMRKRMPLVLKPLNSSGGKNLVRIDGDQVEYEGLLYEWDEFVFLLQEMVQPGLLAMRFLHRVTEGDKRIIVANGKVIVAALRIPPKDSWLANVAQGGASEPAELTPEEEVIAETLSEDLLARGVALFGFDTLVNDDGKRVLSEINSSCVNGIYPAQLDSGKPVVHDTALAIWEFIRTHITPA